MSKKSDDEKSKKCLKVNESKVNESKVNEYEDILKRLQAEFENFKKRTDKEKEEFMKVANYQLMAKILPILDAFEAALKSEKIEKEDIMVLYKQFLNVLGAEGLMSIDAKGKQFDPHIHEVLLHDNDNKLSDNAVIEVIQTGYLLGGKVLRTAKVKINKVKSSER